MNYIVGGTSIRGLFRFFLLPHDLIYDCLEFIVEFPVVYRLYQLAVEHLLFNGSAVRNDKLRMAASLPTFARATKCMGSRSKS